MPLCKPNSAVVKTGWQEVQRSDYCILEKRGESMWRITTISPPRIIATSNVSEEDMMIDWDYIHNSVFPAFDESDQTTGELIDFVTTTVERMEEEAADQEEAFENEDDEDIPEEELTSEEKDLVVFSVKDSCSKQSCVNHADLKELFDSDSEFCYSDVDIVVAGIEKPFRLHRAILGRASNALNSLFQLNEKKFGKYSPEAHRVDWMFESSDENYRRALEKWLRYCYGIEISFEPKECCAALAALFHLDLVNKENLKSLLEKKMMAIAERNMEAGVLMVHESMKLKECHSDSMSRIDKELIEVVLTKKNLMEHTEEWKDCIVRLAPEYLDNREYGPPHSELSEFSIRLSYIQCNKDSLKAEEEKRIVMKCVDEKMNNAELEQLESTQLFNGTEMLQLYRRVQRKTEEIAEGRKREIEKMQKDVEDLKNKTDELEKQKKVLEQELKECKEENDNLQSKLEEAEKNFSKTVEVPQAKERTKPKRFYYYERPVGS